MKTLSIPNSSLFIASILKKWWKIYYNMTIDVTVVTFHYNVYNVLYKLIDNNQIDYWYHELGLCVMVIVIILLTLTTTIFDSIVIHLYGQRIKFF